MNFFKVLFALVKKDLKLFFRSRYSSILALLIPLIVILCVGYAFNSGGISNVHVGIYSDSNANFTDKIVSNFESNGFSKVSFNSLDDCVNSVKLGQTQICAYFYQDNSSKDSVKFYVDNSRMNLVDSLLQLAKLSVNEESSSIMKSSTQNLIDLVNSTKQRLPQVKDNLNLASGNISNSNSILSSMTSLDSKFITLLGYLSSAKSNANDSVAISKIDSSINLANSLKSDFNSTYEKSLDAKSYGGNVLNQISLAISGINTIENSIVSGKIKSVDEITSPINVQVESLNLGLKNRDYLMVILLSVILLFGSILLSSTFVMKEKKTKAYFRNFMTPAKDGMFVLSSYISCLIIIAVQIALAILGLHYILQMSFFVFSLPLLVVLFLAISVFIFIGMFVGYLFRSEEGVIFVSMIVATVFVFFSNTILPIENISRNLFRFSFVNPLVSLNLALKKILFFGFGFSSIYSELIVFGSFIVGFLLLSYFSRRLTRRVL